MFNPLSREAETYAAAGTHFSPTQVGSPTRARQCDARPTWPTSSRTTSRRTLTTSQLSPQHLCDRPGSQWARPRGAAWARAARHRRCLTATVTPHSVSQRPDGRTDADGRGPPTEPARAGHIHTYILHPVNAPLEAGRRLCGGLARRRRGAPTPRATSNWHLCEPACAPAPGLR